MGSMSFTAGLAATKTGVDLVKLVVEAVKSPELDRNAIHARLLEIMDYLLEAKMALSDAQDEQRKLQSEYEGYKAEQEKRKAVVEGEGAYWSRKENGKLDGPFCTYCSDVDGKLVRMRCIGEREHVEFGMRKEYRCLIHENFLVKISSAKFLQVEIS